MGGRLRIGAQVDSDSVTARYAVELGRRIRALRRRRGDTLTMLGRNLASGPIPGGTVRTWEVASCDMPLSRIIAVARYFGIDPHELLAPVDACLRPQVDVWALAHSDEPVLAVARRWALTILRTPDAATIITWPDYALPPLAVLTGCTVDELRTALSALTRKAMVDGTT